jgi:hypothetical protein
MEYNVHGQNSKAHNIIRDFHITEKRWARTNHISIHKWEIFYQVLFYKRKDAELNSLVGYDINIYYPELNVLLLILQSFNWLYEAAFSIEDDTGLAIKEFPMFDEIQNFIIVSTNIRHWILFWARRVVLNIFIPKIFGAE